jgi:hypothetical protein
MVARIPSLPATFSAMALRFSISFGFMRTYMDAPPRSAASFLKPKSEIQERNWLGFGVASGGGVVSSISESDVFSLIERENLIPFLGGGLPPENFDFGGMSGGPVLSVVEYRGLLRRGAESELGLTLNGTLFYHPTAFC